MSARSPTPEPGFVVQYGGREISHNLLFWPLQSVGWLVYGLMMLGYALARETRPQAIFDIVLLVVTGYALTLTYRHLFRRWRRQHLPPLKLAVLVVALTIVGTPLWYESQVLITRITYSLRPSLVSSFPSYAVIPLRISVFWGITLLTWSLLYFSINGWGSFERERRGGPGAIRQTPGSAGATATPFSLQYVEQHFRTGRGRAARRRDIHDLEAQRLFAYLLADLRHSADPGCQRDGIHPPLP
jgi:hypothetical protein